MTDRAAALRGRSARLRLRDASGACRPAPRPEHRRARRPDLPDHELRVRGSGVGCRVLQPAGVREHLLADHEPDGGGVRGAHGEPRGRLWRGRVRERDRGAGGGVVHAAPAGRPRRLVVCALRRHRQPVQAPAAQDERRPDLGRPGRPGRVASGAPREHQGCSTARRSATRAATCSTSRRSPRSRTSTRRR